MQKYKARSIARTIGKRASDPLSLVRQIMASTEARPAYERMLSLEKQIQEAQANSRFYLRRDMDVHKSEIKKISLLRQLINLREGSPLDLADIPAINANIGSKVVLVD